MRTNTRMAGMIAMVLTMLASSIAAAQSGMSGGMSGNMPGMRMSKMAAGDTAHMMEMMRTWPQASKDAAMFMAAKYGAPMAMTDEMAMWGKTGPWKRTVVYGKEYPHEFPAHHTDVMQQWIDYKAPPAMYAMLAAYDGSVVLERTSGEASARCDKEAANFLALNLADEIVRGKRTVEAARRMYGEQIMAMKAMKPAPYTEKLMFGMMMNTNDPDRAGAMPSVMVGRKR